MTSSTSSSESKNWRGFFATLVGVAVALAGVLYAWVVVVDPFDTLPVSPDLDRVPIATNARYSFPALARHARFDSAIIGTSTSRLLRPERLNSLFGGSFANLAMNSATAYEQTQILSLFARSHAQPRAVLIGIDTVWCETGSDFERFTPRPFPAWMYDDNPWNDLREMFNFFSLEQAGRQLATMIGTRPIKYGRNGYTSFLPAPEQYDEKKVAQALWGGGAVGVVPVNPPVVLSADERAALYFPTHDLMAAALAELPVQTQKILFFVPYHISAQAAPGSQGAAQWRECKARMVAMAGVAENTSVVDFMIDSPITATDGNYWDRLHYSVEIADQVAEDLHSGSAGGSNGRFRLLFKPGG
ncbi:MAG: hypothetical protein ACTSX7_15045 [Alphaproteobacteria bacterium]